MLAREKALLFSGLHVAQAHNLEQALKGVRVEEMVARLPEDASQVPEELLQDLLDILVLTSVNQEEDSLGSAEGIRPQIHLQSILELQLSHVEKLGGALFI